MECEEACERLIMNHKIPYIISLHNKNTGKRKFPQKFQLNPSSRLGGVVVTRFGNRLTDGQGMFID